MKRLYLIILTLVSFVALILVVSFYNNSQRGDCNDPGNGYEICVKRLVENDSGNTTEGYIGEMDISFDIPTGWYLEKTTRDLPNNDAKYTWLIGSDDSDGVIDIRSFGFAGSIQPCTSIDELAEAKIVEISPTDTKDIIYIKYETVIGSEKLSIGSLSLGNELIFRENKDPESDLMQTSSLDTGDYYRCKDLPGTNLGLTKNNSVNSKSDQINIVYEETAGNRAGSLTNGWKPLPITHVDYPQLELIIKSIK